MRPYGYLILVASLIFAVLLPVNCIAISSTTKDDVLFYATFDGSFDATISKGNGKLQNSTTSEFTEGYQGKAILTGSKGSELNYLTAGNCKLKAGSVAMWIKPVGWGESDSWMRFYFRFHEPSGPNSADSGNFVWLYKYFIYPVTWLVQQDTYKRSFYSVTPGSGDRGGAVRFEWKQDTWAHVIATWSGSQMSLYVNGQFVGTAYTPSPNLLSALDSTFIIGGQNRNGDGVQDLAIDNVLILDKPVTPGYAKAIYEKGIDALQPSSKSEVAPVFNITATFNPRLRKANVNTEVVGWDTSDLKGSTLEYQIHAKDKPGVLLRGRTAITALNQRSGISTKSLKPGEYLFRGNLVLDKKPIVSAETILRVTALPNWVGNKFGVFSAVTAPWTPMKASSKAITCWGREYKWGDNAFPSQINSAGTELLSGPIRMTAKIAGKTVKTTQGSFKVTKVSETRVDFTSSARLGNIPLKVNGYLEFDGFMWLNATLGSKSSNVTLQRLTLDIPMRSEAATLVNGNRGAIRCGALHPMTTALGLEPVIWFGNEKCGLQWSTDSFKDWNVQDKNKLLQVEQAGATTNIRFVLADNPTSLKGKSLSYTFGLQATPVKPMPSGRREWELELVRAYKWHPDPETSKEGRMSPTYWSQWGKVDNQPDGPYGRLQASPYTFEELDRVNPRNLYPYLYWNLGMLWNGEEVLQTFSDWGEYQKNAHPYTSIASRHWDPDMRDYMVWRVNHLFIDNPTLASRVTGLYLDTSQAGWSNESYSVLGTRDLQKRAYLSVKQKWPQLLFMNHESGSVHMFQLAFADMMLSGEHYTDSPLLIANLDYHELLDYDVIRSEFLGSNFGIPLVFLPEIGRCVGTDVEKTAFVYSDKGIPAVEHLTGMLWLHDVPMLTSWVNPVPMVRVNHAKMLFGWDDQVAFKGYWENADYVTLQSDKPAAQVSFFKRNGRVLFVVMNNSDEDAKVTLTPNWTKLGIKAPVEMDDVYAEQQERRPIITEQVIDGKVEFTIKARNFRALVAY